MTRSAWRTAAGEAVLALFADRAYCGVLLGELRTVGFVLHSMRGRRICAVGVAVEVAHPLCVSVCAGRKRFAAFLSCVEGVDV